jgi:hypothetical protein
MNSRTLLQAAAIACGILIVAVIFHKGHANISALAERHSGAKFWRALARCFLKNLARRCIGSAAFDFPGMAQWPSMAVPWLAAGKLVLANLDTVIDVVKPVFARKSAGAAAIFAR